MPKRILLRIGKAPFEVVNILESDERDVAGTNSGNMLFAQSVFKTLSIDDVEIGRHGYGANPKRADFINENYDAVVLPMANSFRVAWAPALENYYELVRRLKIPVIVAGVGVQTDLDYNLDNLKPIDDISRRFVSAVLDRSASIGVRGECSAAYLKKLGFPESSIDIIGCPSMFMYGENLAIRDPGTISLDSPISINVTSAFKKGCFRNGLDLMLHLADNHIQKYRNSVVICQESRSLTTMLWGGGKGSEFDGISPESIYELTANKRAKFFVDPSTWFDYLSKFQFSFGTRLHGNIASILGGTPAFILAPDSRTRELAELFHIPYRRMDEIDENLDARELAESADFSRMLNGHSALFENYVKFIKKNNLPCIYDFPGKAEEFDRRLSTERFPKAAETCAPDVIIERLGKFRRETLLTLRKLEKQVTQSERKAERLTASNRKRDSRLKKLIAMNASLDGRLDRIERRISRLGTSKLSRLRSYAKRKLKRLF
ncbi:hypothetical protein J2Y48_002300 [Mycoplana sp. BE70]|uniref:polysaccharide pyruvyl transferase family protein n=1 Tax=Mycoplana sp. BE70 TaxID=2817775 RepID=UPI0028589A33|nr:polysaccharide pyruvyl transferase family protein [Mycoplana sp. BE70]MDR6757004.1 hypothetical protein [Mycoplana sp. BE70]